MTGNSFLLEARGLTQPRASHALVSFGGPVHKTIEYLTFFLSERQVMVGYYRFDRKSKQEVSP